MPRYRQPPLPGLPLFIPRRKGKQKRVVRQGGKTYSGKNMPQGLHILSHLATTAKVNKARRKVV